MNFKNKNAELKYFKQLEFYLNKRRKKKEKKNQSGKIINNKITLQKNKNK